MKDMTQAYDTDMASADQADDAIFGAGPERYAVEAARFFCLAFAFIVPNVLLINHVWGF